MKLAQTCRITQRPGGVTRRQNVPSVCSSFSRRDLLATIPLSSVVLLGSATDSLAEEESAAGRASTYQDPIEKFELVSHEISRFFPTVLSAFISSHHYIHFLAPLSSQAIPPGWSFAGQGETNGPEQGSFFGISGARRVLGWTDATGTASVSLVITNVAAQFTKMGSFGSPLDFAQNTVNLLDESFREKVDRAAKRTTDADGAEIVYQKARLADLDPKDFRGCYLFDYTIVRGPVARHCYQLVGMGNTGTYNRLYTLTGAVPMADAATHEKAILSILKSFKATDLVR